MEQEEREEEESHFAHCELSSLAVVVSERSDACSRLHLFHLRRLVLSNQNYMRRLSSAIKLEDDQ